MSEVIRSHRWKKDRQHNGQNKNEKKSLKMPKRLSEAIDGRRTDNTMAKIKRTRKV
jgi:hypothetical protein